jgi:hypothetical protein
MEDDVTDAICLLGVRGRTLEIGGAAPGFATGVVLEAAHRLGAGVTSLHFCHGDAMLHLERYRLLAERPLPRTGGFGAARVPYSVHHGPVWALAAPTRGGFDAVFIDATGDDAARAAQLDRLHAVRHAHRLTSADGGRLVALMARDDAELLPQVLLRPVAMQRRPSGAVVCLFVRAGAS